MDKKEELISNYEKLLESVEIKTDADGVLTTGKRKVVIDGLEVRLPTDENIKNRWLDDTRRFTLFTPHLEDVVRGQHKSAVWLLARMNKVLNVNVLEILAEVLDTLESSDHNPTTTGIVECVMSRKTSRSKSILGKDSASVILKQLMSDAKKGRLVRLGLRKSVKVEGKVFIAGSTVNVPAVMDSDEVVFKRTMDSKIYQGLLEGLSKYVIKEGLAAVSDDGYYARFLVMVKTFIQITKTLQVAAEDMDGVAIPDITIDASVFDTDKVDSIVLSFPPEQYANDKDDSLREGMMDVADMNNATGNNVQEGRPAWADIMMDEPVKLNTSKPATVSNNNQPNIAQQYQNSRQQTQSTQDDDGEFAELPDLRQNNQQVQYDAYGRPIQQQQSPYVAQDTNPYVNPYANAYANSAPQQNPYAASSYAQQQNPHGQQADPYANVYAQQQNPYGANPYAQQQNPYAQPQQAYGVQNPYGANPYSQPQFVPQQQQGYSVGGVSFSGAVH